MPGLRSAVVAALATGLIVTALMKHTLVAAQSVCENYCNGRSTLPPTYSIALGRCVCTCRNQWSGTQCQDCPIQFDASNDCYGCNSPNYVGTYPNCTSDACTLLDCNNRADSVTGLRSTGCVCNCINQWTGGACQTCAPRFDPNQACGACSALYGDYPTCALLCTNAANCSSHAKVVTGTIASGCVCTCSNSWAGSNCNSCAAGINATDNCGSCVKGYTNYPNCVRTCTNVMDCSNRASLVNGTAGNCGCTCRNQWYMSACSKCSSIYDPAQDCGTCSVLYEKYPDCWLKCTNSANCTAHATAVSGNVANGCNCTCRNLWHGPKCDQCPALLNASKDCGQCVNLYGGYPNCKRICTLAQDCGGTQAVSVSGLEGACVCTCANQWTNSSCNVCPPFYNASLNCGKCISTRDTYPSCYLTCTTQDNCTGNAVSVTGNDKVGCAC